MLFGGLADRTPLGVFTPSAFSASAISVQPLHLPRSAVIRSSTFRR